MRSFSRREIPSLTGLRGVAALLVVISHYWIWAKVSDGEKLPDTIGRWFGTSTIGMAIFFTLSGYVIALNYSHWDWRRRPFFNLARLFAYRFARLYPAFLAFVIVAVLWAAPLHDLTAKNTVEYLWPHLLLVQTWLPMKFDGVLPSDGRFHVSWSLSVECALYVLFAAGAILVVGLPRWRMKSATLGIGFFVITWLMLDLMWRFKQAWMPSNWSDADAFRWLFLFSPCAAALQFGIGVAACRLSVLPQISRFGDFASNAGLLAIITIHAATARGIIAPSGFDQGVWAALATGLLMVGASADSVANRILSGRAIIYIGTISYSLYLFHFVAPPLALHGRFFSEYSAAAMAAHAVNIAMSLGLAIIFATGAYQLIEVPGRRFIRNMADRVLGMAVDPATVKRAATR